MWKMSLWDFYKKLGLDTLLLKMQILDAWIVVVMFLKF